MSFHVLCSVCEEVFAGVKKGRYTFSYFHSITELVESAKGCHFCNIVTEDMRSSGTFTKGMENKLLSKNDRLVTAAEQRLKAETRYVEDIGVSFLLRCIGAFELDVLASVDLLFDDSAGKLRQIVCVDIRLI